MRRADSKRRIEPILLPPDAACWVEATEPPLGQLFAAARERRGLTPEQAAHDARVMVPYLKMIECGNYSAIPDMLYLLPFIQRYAAFLGLNVKEVTARFVRDFEAEENAAAAPAAPVAPSLALSLRMLPWQRIVQVSAVASVAILLAGIAFAVTRAASQHSPEISPSALTSLPPPVHVRIESTPVAAAATPATQLSEAAPTAAQVAVPKATTSQRRRQARGVSSPHHRRRRHYPG